MPDPTFSPSAFTLWHESVRAVALGLLGLLFAYTALQHMAIRLRGHQISLFAGDSLRRTLVVGLVLVGSLPAASLGLLLAERSAMLREERMTGQLRDLAFALASDVDQFIDKHRAGVISAAHAASASGDLGPDALAGWLQIFHRTYPDFLTMLATNERGDIVAATALLGGLPAPISDLVDNVADRPYFQRPLADGQPYVSKVFQGRGLGQDPIVAVSAPLTDADGQPRGVLEGSLNLRAFRVLESSLSLVGDASAVVLDPELRVVYASPSLALHELQSLASAPMVVAARGAGIGDAFRYDVKGTGAKSYFGASSATRDGWIVLLRQPLDPIYLQMWADYRVALILLLIAAALSFSLASAIARRVTLSVDHLSGVVRSFRLDGQGETLEVPDGTPTEFVPIFEQMRQRSQRLRSAHKRLKNSIAAGERLRRELNQSIASKDVEIEKRTAALENANARLEQINRSDPLTGIANRRAFESFEKEAWAAAAREQETLTIIMIDIDYFKDYNDSQGHQKGDECLRSVARALAGCATRETDLVARFGGEEFIAMLSGTPLEKGLAMADRMRRAVQALNLPHDGSPRGVVTVSVGVAAGHPWQQDDAQAALLLADKALYEAKRDGRNRVFFAAVDGFERYRGPGRSSLRAVDRA